MPEGGERSAAQDLRILILAPGGRDACLARDALAGAGLQCYVCRDFAELCREAGLGAGAVLLTEEALPPGDAGNPDALVGSEPAWSALPIIALTRRTSSPGGFAALRRLEHRSKVSFLPRPVPKRTLVSTVRSAVANRRRQYLTRDLIEAQQRAHQAAKDREMRLRLALDAGGMGTWEWDLVNDTGTWDDRQYELCGFRPGDRAASMGSAFLQLVHPEDRPAVERLFNGAAGATGEINHEFRIFRPDGEARWLAIRGRIASNDVGRPSRMIGLTWDVTERKRTERALVESEARFREMADNLPLIVWVHDGEGRQEFVNRTFCEYFGVTREEMRDERWQILMHPDDADAYSAEFRASVRDRRPFHGEVRVRRADGDWRWIESWARPRFDANGVFIGHIGTSADVTERKQSARHRELLIQELDHRVKNMLAVVQAVAHQTFPRNSGDRGLADAFQSRLVALAAAHDLLTLSSFERVSLGGLIRQVLGGAGGEEERVRLAGPDVAIEPKVAETLAMAFHELWTNALKYGALSDRRGHVDVEWTLSGSNLELIWKEQGGPPVVPPRRKGFGSRMIERSLAQQLDGEATMDYRPEGLVCTIRGKL